MSDSDFDVDEFDKTTTCARCCAAVTPLAPSPRPTRPLSRSSWRTS